MQVTQKLFDLEHIMMNSDLVVVDSCTFIGPKDRCYGNKLTPIEWYESLRDYYNDFRVLASSYNNVYVDPLVLEEIRNHQTASIKKRLNSIFAKRNRDVVPKLTVMARAFKDKKKLVRDLEKNPPVEGLSEEYIDSMFFRLDPYIRYFKLTPTDTKLVANSVGFASQGLEISLLTGDSGILRATRRFWNHLRDEDFELKGSICCYSLETIDDKECFSYRGHLE